MFVGQQFPVLPYPLLLASRPSVGTSPSARPFAAFLAAQLTLAASRGSDRPKLVMLGVVQGSRSQGLAPRQQISAHQAKLQLSRKQAYDQYVEHS